MTTIETKPTVMYCEENPAHPSGTYYTHFFQSPGQVRMCRSEKEAAKPIIQVEVSEGQDTPGSYWGWWDAGEQRFGIVWYRKFLVEMCFPYGTKAEEERGKGKLLPVNIKVLQLGF